MLDTAIKTAPVGSDRFGEQYSTKDVFGKFGVQGKILVGSNSRTTGPRVWITDNGSLDYQPVDKVKRGISGDTFDPFEFQKLAAHKKGFSGWWGGRRNTWNDFSYQEVRANQKKPSFFLIRREAGGNAAGNDNFVTKGNGLFVKTGRQFYWFPNSVKAFDPTSGEYIDKNGVRRFNGGQIWIRSQSSWNDDFKSIVKDSAVAAAYIGAFAYTAGAVNAAITAPVVAGTGAVVGPGIAAESAIVATPLAAETGAVVAAGSTITASAATATGTVVASTFLDDSIDFVKDTAKDLFKDAVVGAATDNGSPQPGADYATSQPVYSAVDKPETAFNTKTFLAIATMVVGVISLVK